MFLTRSTPARKTRRSVGKATAGEKSRRTLRYDEFQNEARTRQGKRRVPEQRDYFGKLRWVSGQLPGSGE